MNITFTVKLFAYFRDNRFLKRECEYPEGISVGEIVAGLDIDFDEVGVLMINSRHCAFTSQPQAGDSLAIFPKVGGG